MANHSRETRYLRRTVLATVGLGLVVYLTSSLISGERGLKAAERTRAQIVAGKESLKALGEERAFWQRRVDALDPAHLDLDMLGEQARRRLFFAGPDEVVLLPADDQ